MHDINGAALLYLAADHARNSRREGFVIIASSSIVAVVLATRT